MQTFCVCLSVFPLRETVHDLYQILQIIDNSRGRDPEPEVEKAEAWVWGWGGEGVGREELVGESLVMQEGKGHCSEGQAASLRSVDFTLGAIASRGVYVTSGLRHVTLRVLNCLLVSLRHFEFPEN